MSIILILAFTYLQACTVSYHFYIMDRYKQICGRCDWWWEPGAKRMRYMSLIPFLGPFLCIAAHGDIVRNIILELSKPDA